VEQKNLVVLLEGNHTSDAPAAPQRGHSNFQLGLLEVPVNTGFFKQLSNNARRYSSSINDSIFAHSLSTNYSNNEEVMQVPINQKDLTHISILSIITFVRFQEQIETNEIQDV
jgi:hypothetical protein